MPEPEPFVAPPWWEPPTDQYPSRVAVREFIASTPGTVVTISHIDVYSTGILIAVEWEVRRLDETVNEWQATIHLGGHYGRGTASALRFGLALSDGTVVTTSDSFPSDGKTAPEGWSLQDRSGGGGGDGRRYSGTSGLWLWPLPPAGPIELVAEWGDRGVPESRLVLDGSLLLAEVGNIRSLWP